MVIVASLEGGAQSAIACNRRGEQASVEPVSVEVTLRTYDRAAIGRFTPCCSRTQWFDPRSPRQQATAAGGDQATQSTSDMQLISPEHRIRNAVLAGFHVTRQSVFEGCVAFDPDDEVVPAVESI